jgi:cytochrome b
MSAHATDRIAQAAGSEWVRVWNPLVRIAHWTLATAFFVAYVVEDKPLWLHVWAGYVVGGVVFLRFVWGFVGPKHARSFDFLYRPSMVFRYLADLLRLRGKRQLSWSAIGRGMRAMSQAPGPNAWQSHTGLNSSLAL